MPKIGGARIGAGRKPKVPKLAVIRASVEDWAVSVIAPEDLPVEQQALWAEYTPLAIEVRTLTKHTQPSFRLLCALEAERMAVGKILDEDGRTYLKAWVDSSGQEHEELKAHPLKSDYAKLFKLVEMLMARFCLAPFGKPTAVQPHDATQDKKKHERFFG